MTMPSQQGRAPQSVIETRLRERIAQLEQVQRAWEFFASHAIPLMPVLTRQLMDVIEQTECAALDLTGAMRSIAERAKRHTDTVPCQEGAVAQIQDDAKALAADVSRLIMAMQFQDITKQTLEHVAQPLAQMQGAMEALLANPSAPEVVVLLNLLDAVERSYTMETERTAMEQALRGHGSSGEPISRRADAITDAEAQRVTVFS